jgi:hypothetical protein
VFLVIRFVGLGRVLKTRPKGLTSRVPIIPPTQLVGLRLNTCLSSSFHKLHHRQLFRAT